MVAESVRIKLSLDLQLSNSSASAKRIEYTIPSRSSEPIVISEDVLVKQLVSFLDDRLGEHLDEDLHVELRSVLHGSLELFLAVSTAIGLSGTVLGNTASLLSNAQAIAEAIEGLTREWMWRRGMNPQDSVTAQPVSRRRFRPALPASAATTTEAVVRRHLGLSIAAAAVVSAVTTAVVIYSMISSDVTVIRNDVERIGHELSYLRGRIAPSATAADN